MKKTKKILFVVLSFVVLLSVCVLPSFAWSIGYDQEGLPQLQEVHKIYNGEYNNDDLAYRFYNNYNPYYYPFNSNNTASNSAFQVQLLYSGGQILNTFVKIPNNTASTVKISVDHFGVLELYVDLTPTSQTSKGITDMYFVPLDDLRFDGLRINITTVPTASTVMNEFSSYVENVLDGESPIIDDLRAEIAYKDAVIAQRDETIRGLQNNNVLDGTFSGIGEGFSTAITPLLSLGVGGVTLGNVLGTLLIIGVILLFVLIINKIRGA